MSDCRERVVPAAVLLSVRSILRTCTIYKYIYRYLLVIRIGLLRYISNRPSASALSRVLGAAAVGPRSALPSRTRGRLRDIARIAIRQSATVTQSAPHAKPSHASSSRGVVAPNAYAASASASETPPTRKARENSRVSVLQCDQHFGLWYATDGCVRSSTSRRRASNVRTAATQSAWPCRHVAFATRSGSAMPAGWGGSSTS